MSSDRVSTWQAWHMAIRPHTLPAAVSPVIVGVGLGVHHGVLAPVPSFVAAVCAVLLQAATNVANDYFDAEKGVDEDRTHGFDRVTASGYLAPGTVFNGMVTLYALAVLLGAYLVYVGGLPILTIGLLGVFCGVTYSGGPVPYGSYALGDVMVFLFFGVVAVTGTYFVQAVAHGVDAWPVGLPAGTLPWDVVLASLPAAALSTAILVVNNLRDLETDRSSGKMTLAVLLGRAGTRVEFTCLVTVAYVVPAWLLVMPSWSFSAWVLLPFLSVPLAVLVTTTVWTVDHGAVLNDTLSRTGKLLFVHSLLFAAGLAL